VQPGLFASAENVFTFSHSSQEYFRVSWGIELDSARDCTVKSLRRALFAVEAIQHLDISRRQKVRKSFFVEEPQAQSEQEPASRLLL
jgi:hypothetical protein